MHVQSAESNIIEVYWHIINALSKLILTAKIILLTSVVCDNLNDGASAVYVFFSGAAVIVSYPNMPHYLKGLAR